VQFVCQFGAADIDIATADAEAAASAGELNYKLASELNAPHGVCVIHAENYKLSDSECHRYLTTGNWKIGYV